MRAPELETQRTFAGVRRAALLLVLATAVVLMHSLPAGSAGCPDMGSAAGMSAVSTGPDSSLSPTIVAHGDSPPQPGPHASSTLHVCLATVDAASPDVAPGSAAVVAVLEPVGHEYQSSAITVVQVLGVRPPPRAPDPVVELSVNRV